MTQLEKFRILLQELFQLDQADLDFGIYRIMNQKRDEVVRFLDKDLLPQVKAAFSQYQSADKATVQADLDKLADSIRNAGMQPEDSPKYQELRQNLADSSVDIVALEGEVFSHLYSFFRRYYSEGDFLSLRRYKAGVYAIPYEGEEVKLHWANADQYYVKSSETFRDYTFKVPLPPVKKSASRAASAPGGSAEGRVRFQIVAASTEQDNNKPATGKERRFVLCDPPLSIVNGDLEIRFEYRTAKGKTKQDELNQQAIAAILASQGTSAELDPWIDALATLASTEKKKDRTVLEKHLTQFSARNTFDYFIHKDLGGFLRRELDFYVKNEVMHLDDIEHESAPKVEQYLSQIKVIRSIAHKIIQFLEQLENFQKKLWLKKKFVIETNYCITLDRIPEELYPEIAANDAQREEWVRLFAIDEIKKDLEQPGYTVPLTIPFLLVNNHLPLDTKLFAIRFKDNLARSVQNIDQSTDQVLFHSENFQALQLLRERYRGSISLAYSDPPYNTGGDGFPYKDAYKHSSWAAMIWDRLVSIREMLSTRGASLMSCDDNEQALVVFLHHAIFGDDNFVTSMIWEGGRKNDAKQVSVSHEYVIAACKSVSSLNSAKIKWRQRKEGIDAIYRQATRLKRTCGSDFTAASEAMVAWYDSLPDNNPSKKHKRYCWIDIRTEERGPYFADKIAGPDDGRLSRPRDVVCHPTTRKPVKLPSTGWCWSDIHQKVADGLVHFGRDETTVPNKKTYLKDTEFEAPHSVFYKDGRAATLQLETMMPSSGFANPKDTSVVSRLVNAVTEPGSIVLDCFAGSGTTGHAVIAINRSEGGSRKCILVEMGSQFETVLKPRLLKASYSNEWIDGHPANRKTGLSHCFKYLRLESYEDTLNNLELSRSKQQSQLLDKDADMREQYVLSYMLDVEGRGSQSLLNIEAFRNPDEYQLKVERNGETQLVNVDLVETFNWLLGLTVKHIDVIPFKKGDPGVRVVEGTSPTGDRVLVLWRNIDHLDNNALDKWFDKQGYSSRDLEYDLIYVNGDNNLENLRRTDQTWKVRLIEEEFQRLMFDVEDV